MGCDGLDEKVFATLEQIRSHGGEPWWLYLSRCDACGQNWMVAQEERIFDDYYLKRLTPAEARAIMDLGRWPDDFITYERVLKTGHALSRPCEFLEELAPSLVWTAEDLRKERPEITDKEIAHLLGVSPSTAARLSKT